MEILTNFLQSIKSFIDAAGIPYKAELSLADVIALITFSLALIGLTWATIKYVLVAPVKFIHNNFTSPEVEREKLVSFLLNTHATKKYQTFVQLLLSGLQRFYGDASSNNAFSRCLTIAFVYPILLFLFAYTFFLGNAEFAGFKLFPAVESARFLALLMNMMIAATLIMYKYLFDSLDKKARMPFNKWLQPVTADIVYRLSMGVMTALVSLSFISDWRICILTFGMGLIYRATALVVVVAVVVSGVGGDVVAIGVGGVVVGVSVSVGRGGGGGSSIVVGGFLVALFALLGNYTISLTLVVFFFIFPILNALLDWLSLRVSRFFLEKVKTENNPFWILSDILFDLLIAIGFMLALVIVLPGVIEWVNSLYGLLDAKAVLNWRELVESAIQDPFGKGLMVTSMLITTLIPTVIHIFIGFLAFSINSLFGKQLASYLQQSSPHCLRPWIAAIWLEAYAFFVLILLASLSYLFWTALQFPVGQWLYGIAELGHNKTGLVIFILLGLLLMGLYKPSWLKAKHCRLG